MVCYATLCVNIYGLRGFCECVFVYLCVLLCVHIYYATDLPSYGSEAVDQDNGGDSNKTRQEEGLSGGRGADAE